MKEQIANPLSIFINFQEKTDDAKKAKKEENGDGDDDDEDLDDEEEIEEYNLDYNDDEEIDGEGKFHSLTYFNDRIYNLKF